MTPAAAKRIQQRQVLAFLLAVGALALPVSGAIQQAAFFRDDDLGIGPPWWAPVVGALNASDMIGTLLLVGALALGIVAWGDRRIVGPVSVGIAGTIVVVAALTQGVAFVVGAYLSGFDGAFATPESPAWELATWTLVVRALVQAALCAATAAFALRWMSADHRRTPS